MARVVEEEFKHLAAKGFTQGTMNDRLKAYYLANTPNVGRYKSSINEIELAFLQSQTSSGHKTLHDAWRAFCILRGVPAKTSTNEMKRALFSGPGLP